MTEPIFDACPVCGGSVQRVRELQDVRIGMRTVAIEADVSKCVDCAEVFLTPTQMDDLQRRASETIRRADGLMMPEHIRAVRERLGYTQAEFEHLLGVGPKTVVRWERGTVFQNGATDTLLRVLDNVDAVAPYLARSRGLAEPSVAVHPERPDPVPTERHYVYRAVPAQALGRISLLSFDANSTPRLTPIAGARANVARDIPERVVA